MDDGRLNRHDLSDAEWALLEPLLPDHPRQGHRCNDHRVVIDGVFHRVRVGCPWRDLPERSGNWKTVYSRHRRWPGDGSREKIVDALRVGCDEAEGKARTVAADATVVRAHQHAAAARHAPPKDIPAERLAVNRGTATGKPKPGALFACEQQARARDQADRRGGQSCACAAHHDRPVRSGPLLRQLGATQRTSELR